MYFLYARYAMTKTIAPAAYVVVLVPLDVVLLLVIPLLEPEIVILSVCVTLWLFGPLYSISRVAWPVDVVGKVNVVCLVDLMSDL